MTKRNRFIKTALFFSLLTLAVPSAALGQNRNPGAHRLRLEEQAVTRLERDITEAVNGGDPDAITLILAEEFIFTSPRGVADKARFLESVRAGKHSKMQPAATEGPRVKLYGHTALLKGILIVNENGLNKRMRYTSALVKRARRWQLLALQLTPIAEFVAE